MGIQRPELGTMRAASWIGPSIILGDRQDLHQSLALVALQVEVPHITLRTELCPPRGSPRAWMVGICPSWMVWKLIGRKDLCRRSLGLCMRTMVEDMRIASVLGTGRPPRSVSSSTIFNSSPINLGSSTEPM